MQEILAQAQPSILPDRWGSFQTTGRKISLGMAEGVEQNFGTDISRILENHSFGQKEAIIAIKSVFLCTEF